MSETYSQFTVIEHQLDKLHEQFQEVYTELTATVTSLRQQANIGDSPTSVNRVLEDQVARLKAQNGELQQQAKSTESQNASLVIKYSNLEADLRVSEEHNSKLQLELQEKNELFRVLRENFGGFAPKRSADVSLERTDPKRARVSSHGSPDNNDENNDDRPEDPEDQYRSPAREDADENKDSTRHNGRIARHTTLDLIEQDAHFRGRKSKRGSGHLDRVVGANDKQVRKGNHSGPQHSFAYASSTDTSTFEQKKEHRPSGPATHRPQLDHRASDSVGIAQKDRQRAQGRRNDPLKHQNHTAEPRNVQKPGRPVRHHNHQHDAFLPPPPPSRRLVCHYCYQNRFQCDGRLPCSSCANDGKDRNDCTRTLCLEFSKDGTCTRADTCFMVHDEQGFLFPRTAPTYNPGRNGKLISA